MQSNEIQIDPQHSALLTEIGLDAAGVFTDPRIAVWRSLPDRENATLDHVRPDGSTVRFHIKRYPTHAGSMANRELAGYRLLANAGVPAAPIIAHGRLADGRGFIILQDLIGYTPADKLVEQGTAFEEILPTTAALAAQLHEARLHHRDLYLCHFMIRPNASVDAAGGIDAKLIDMARIGRLDNPLTRRRWIVKDLAQFWFSTTKLPVSDEQRARWLACYAEHRRISTRQLLPAVKRKSQSIARHDAELNRKQPNRNVSIPTRPA